MTIASVIAIATGSPHSDPSASGRCEQQQRAARVHRMANPSIWPGRYHPLLSFDFDDAGSKTVFLEY